MPRLAPHQRERLLAHVYTRDGRHVQIALYGCTLELETARLSASWKEAEYADTRQPLHPADADRWHDDLVAAVLSKAKG